ncbi:MAG: HD domain-containing protein [Bdellovibrionales bacterium]|nr:HD domain-containing protein [Bdellovibrionales bacterium]
MSGSECPNGNSKVDQAVEFALGLSSVRRARELLQSEKIQKLQYHNEAHTLDVIREAALFGVSGGLDEMELTLLFVAAAWHDVGFLENRFQHEDASAKIFQSEYKQHNFQEITEDQVVVIEQMILDTRVLVLPDGAGSEQQANTYLSQYLLDADLSNLGRVDFFDCLDRVISEGGGLTRLDHYIAALGLISRHRWHTGVAENLRLEREMQNARMLVEKIKRIMKEQKFEG